jgi:hypothetical protein
MPRRLIADTTENLESGMFVATGMPATGVAVDRFVSRTTCNFYRGNVTAGRTCWVR